MVQVRATEQPLEGAVAAIADALYLDLAERCGACHSVVPFDADGVRSRHAFVSWMAIPRGVGNAPKVVLRPDGRCNSCLTQIVAG